MVKIHDLVDRKLLHELSANARLSFTEIGRKLGLSEAGARKRVAKLEKSGTIEGYTLRLGKKGAVRVVVLVSIEKSKEAKGIIAQALSFPEVTRAGEISGDMDIFLECVFLSHGEINSFVDSLSAIEGVKEVRSSIILGESNE